MTWIEAVLLIAGGLTAGAVNSLAGGGSLLSVPLLVFAGVPGNAANGSNRLGVLASSTTAVAEFRRQGVRSLRASVPILGAVVLGSFIGASVVNQLDDASFEKAFGVLMVPLLLLSLRRPTPRLPEAPSGWSPGTTFAIFLGIGAYGGAFQAGLGIILTAALLASGFDVVLANAIKVLVTLAVTVAAIPVFLLAGEIAWLPGLTLAAGFAGGGVIGARLTITKGELLVRPIMIVAVIASAAKLLGLWG